MRIGVLVYISGPITPKEEFMAEENVIEGLKMHLKLTEMGIPSHCPMLVGGYPSAWLVDWEDWIALDFAIINRCTHVLLLPRWLTSKGALEERDYAITKGIPIAESLDELVKMLEESDARAKG
jgi:hypothetical protein